MLREYLCSAQDTLEAKKEIFNVKTQRLHLAQEEYNHLNALAASRTSCEYPISTGILRFEHVRNDLHSLSLQYVLQQAHVVQSSIRNYCERTSHWPRSACSDSRRNCPGYRQKCIILKRESIPCQGKSSSFKSDSKPK